MSLTDGDKAECKEIAREIIAEVLTVHVSSCPHGIQLVKDRAILIGACIGSGLGSGGIVALITHLTKGS